jgi:hypothetical protein
MTINTLSSGIKSAAPPSWWKYGYVWLVIAGPLIVVVAAIFTAVLAFNSNDVIVSDNDPKTAALANYRSLVPAQTASYHAATPDAGMLAARAHASGSPVAQSPGTHHPDAAASNAREPIQ